MSGKALAAVVAAAVALLVAGAAQPRPHAPSKDGHGLPLLGVVTDGGSRQTLVRVDATRLRVLRGARIDVRYVSGGWAYSPDRNLLAIGRYDNPNLGIRDTKASIRLVDPRAMKVVAEIGLGPGILEGDALVWARPDRIVTLALDCCTDDVDIVVVDPAARRIVERRPLHADPIRAVRAGDDLVVLAAPQTGIGPVSMLAIGADGAVRSAALDRIDGGSERTGEGEEDIGVNYLGPDLVIDGGRAIAFSPTGLAAEVDLGSLAVTYHPLAAVAAAARAKRFAGSSLSAQSVGPGVVALTGSSTRLYTDKNGQEQFRRTPAGLYVLDTRHWSARTIDPNADSVRIASDKALTEDLLLATGSRYDSGAGGVETSGNGLTAYTLTGRRVFRLFRGQEVYVGLVYRTRAFVSLYSETLSVVSLGGQRVIGRRDWATLPWLISPSAD